MLTQHPRIRVGLYLLSVLAGAAAIIVTVFDSALGAAMTAAAGTLAIASGAVAMGNVPKG